MYYQFWVFILVINSCVSLDVWERKWVMSWTGVCLLLNNDKDIGINYLWGVCQFLTCFYLMMWNKEREVETVGGLFSTVLCMINSKTYMIISIDIDRYWSISIYNVDPYYISIRVGWNNKISVRTDLNLISPCFANTQDKSRLVLCC